MKNLTQIFIWVIKLTMTFSTSGALLFSNRSVEGLGAFGAVTCSRKIIAQNFSVPIVALDSVFLLLGALTGNST